MGGGVTPAGAAHLEARYNCDFETSPARQFGEVSIAVLSAIEAGFEPNPEDGTERAINYSTLGVAAESAPRSRRGGARNSAARESHALTAPQVANLQAAERHARDVGLPFTRMITIHWEAAGVPLNGMAKATGWFVDLLTKTLSRHGCRTAVLWVHENGDRKGGHCHLLAHVPAELVPLITRHQRSWLRRITGLPYRKKVIRGKPIGGRLGNELSNPTHHAANLKAALDYLLKGASADAADLLGLERREEGGIIIGKRCGTSQNIGAKARQRSRNAD